MRIGAAGLLVVLILNVGSNRPAIGQAPISGRLGGYYAFFVGHRLSHPPDFISGRNRLRLNGRLDHSKGTALASVRLTQAFFDTQEGGSFSAPSARLWEAFIDLYLSDVDIRVGQQLAVWGQADGAFITDVLSPLDLSEFLAQDITEIRLPIPALRASYFTDVLSATALMTIVPTETRIPTESSPWFVVPDLPAGFGVRLGDSDLPGFAVRNFEPAVRLSYSAIDLSEISLIYFYGFNRIPVFGTRIAEFTAQGLDAIVIPTYFRRHVIGLRWSTALTDPWVLDSEAAFSSRYKVEIDPFSAGFDPLAVSDDLLATTRRLQGMFGIERPFGANFARFQVIGDLVTPHEPAYARDRFITSVTAYFRRSFHRETLMASIFVFHNVGRDSWFNPAVLWSPGAGLNLQAGLHVFTGGSDRTSITTSAFSLYRGNDHFYIRVTQHF